MRRRLSTCKWCAAPIRWAFTSQDRHLPIDAHPVADGNLVLTMDDGGYAHVRALRRGEIPPQQLWIAHSVTCPSRQAIRARDRYRRQRRSFPPMLGAQQLEIAPPPDDPAGPR